MLSREVILELRAEQTRLRKQADMIESLLEGVSDSEQGVLTFREPIPELSRRLPNGSFAGQVRAVLRELGRTATGEQVAQRMIDRGAPPSKSGKPLKNRVSVELFRMSKKATGPVEKLERGRYRMKQESQ